MTVTVKTFLAELAQRLRLASLIAHIRTPLYRNGYALLLSTGATSALGIVFWGLAARLYSTEAVGLNSAAISAMTFISGVSQLNLQGTLIRYVPQMGGRSARFVAIAYLSTLGLAAVLGLIFTLGLSFWAPNLKPMISTPFLILWFILAIMMASIFTVQDAVLAGMRQALWVPVENALFAVAKIALLIAFAGMFTSKGIFAAWTICMIATVIPINYLIFTRLIPRHADATAHNYQPIKRRELASYVAGNYVNSLLGAMSNSLLPVIVFSVAGATANAYFYLAWLIASSLQLIAPNMTTSLTIEATLDRSKLAHYSRQMLANLLLLTVPLVIIVILAAPLILEVFGHVYAEEGVTLLRLLTLAAIPNLVNFVYLSIARVQNRVWGIIFVQGAVSFQIIGLGFVLLKIYGGVGIGWAVLFSQCLVAVVLLATEMRPIVFFRKKSTLQPSTD